MTDWWSGAGHCIFSFFRDSFNDMFQNDLDQFIYDAQINRSQLSNFAKGHTWQFNDIVQFVLLV